MHVSYGSIETIPDSYSSSSTNGPGGRSGLSQDRRRSKGGFGLERKGSSLDGSDKEDVKENDWCSCSCSVIWRALSGWLCFEGDIEGRSDGSKQDQSSMEYGPLETQLLLGPPQVSMQDAETVREVNINARHTVSFLPGNESDIAPISFRQKYVLGRLIGEGTSSSCYLCRRLADGQEFACKVINLKRLYTTFPKPVVDKFRQEIDTLELLDHPNIIKLEDHFCSPSTIYIVLELIKGGELFNRIVEQDGIAEYEAKLIFKQLAQAVSYMHDKGVIHRDIKPENVMITKPDSSEVKIIDFGFSKVMDGPFADSFMGTGGFLAPELVSTKCSYSTSVDIWSLGVTLYVILTCCLPFDRSIDPRPDGAFKLSFRDPPWDNISESAKHLLRCILQPNPKIRYTAKQILKHSWLQEPKNKLLSKLETNLLRSKTWTIPLNPGHHVDRSFRTAEVYDGKTDNSDDELEDEDRLNSRSLLRQYRRGRGGVLMSRDISPIRRSTSMDFGRSQGWG